MKNKNAGFSLVELIVVIAVMVIVSAIGGSWFSRMGSYRARECSSKISNSLTATKVKAMSKAQNSKDVIWELTKEDGFYYVNVTYPDYNAGTTFVEKSKVAKSSAIVVTYDTTTSTGVAVSDLAPLKICYNRNTGRFLDDSGSDFDITKIYTTVGNKTYTIELVPATGKVNGTS